MRLRIGNQSLTAVITRDAMRGGVAYAPNFTKELGDLAGQDALILETTDQVVLRLLT